MSYASAKEDRLPLFCAMMARAEKISITAGL